MWLWPSSFWMVNVPAALRLLSPVAWQHVNLLGSFEFGGEDPIVDMKALAAHYAY